ncbi:class I SAM-dependent methyltransferase [Tepidamorphus sp. 3E244]|uniref:class I SAM-dependent methyltransferase n=1 Tax=Tepidamorphus sp. 3E244 TaxID=3385498 RepID=UPI0038FC6D08
MTNINSPYYDQCWVTRAVERGDHREVVGGMWEEIGSLQLNLLVSHGLKPDEYLLDIGCGSLRGGVHIVRFLEPEHYFGTDLNSCLLDAGYRRELLPLGLDKKLPRTSLIVDDAFSFERFGVRFDRALAFSVFTHLPLNSIRVCLERLAEVMVPGGIFHATFFELPVGTPSSATVEHAPAGIVTHGDLDPYHYKLADLRYAANGLPWKVEYVGSINHPRGQRLVNFVRLTTVAEENPGSDI